MAVLYRQGIIYGRDEKYNHIYPYRKKNDQNQKIRCNEK